MLATCWLLMTVSADMYMLGEVDCNSIFHIWFKGDGARLL